MREGTRWQFVGFVVLLVALHFLLRVGLGLGPLVPDLLAVALLVSARRVDGGTAAAIGFALGLLDGAAHPLSMGAGALVMAVVGYLAARSREALDGDSPVLLALYVFAGKWLVDALLFGVLAARGVAGSPSELLLASPLAALYAAAAAVAAVGLFRAVA